MELCCSTDKAHANSVSSPAPAEASSCKKNTCSIIAAITALAAIFFALVATGVLGSALDPSIFGGMELSWLLFSASAAIAITAIVARCCYTGAADQSQGN